MSASLGGVVKTQGRRLGRVVFVRHGESIWNCTPVRFTGWANVPLSDKGRAQALEVGKTLQMFGIRPDVVYTSLLRRSIESMDEIAKSDDARYKLITRVASWRLNERHYGALVGLSKDEASAQMGEEKVMRWRKSWNEAPPPMLKENLYTYKEAPWAQPLTIVNISNSTSSSHKSSTHVEKNVSMPLTESLQDCCQRVLPLWREAIIPHILKGETVLIVAHANSIRAVVKHIDSDSISDECVRKINIPSAIPLVYDFAEATPEQQQQHGGNSPVLPTMAPTGKPNAYGMRGRYIASRELILSLRKNLQNDNENDESLLASLDDSVAASLMIDPRSDPRGSQVSKSALVISASGAGIAREHYAATALATADN